MDVEWINPLIGGALISFSLCSFVIINNLRFGVGTMLRNALEHQPSISWNNQILFLIGLIISPVTFSTLFYPITGSTMQNKPLIIMGSGLLVGLGYQLCNGGLITRAVLLGMSSLKTSLIVILLFLLFGGLGRLTFAIGHF
tara:strand:- start:49 stop:471 length:423 start_codon:yes stop_codon:yes gene_type:complete